MVRLRTVGYLAVVTLITLLALGWVGVVAQSARSVRNYHDNMPPAFLLEARVTCRFDHPCPNVDPSARLDIIGVPSEAACHDMGGEPHTDGSVIVCENVGH